MKSNKKIKKQNKRKTKKKQFGGAAGTPKFRCKSPNDVNDSELDKFYNNLESKRWQSKDSKKCKSFLQKLEYQSKINDDKPEDMSKLFSINSLEDNTDLDKLFQELYNCLPVSVSERPLLPALAMFPSTNYTNNLNFDIDAGSDE